MSSPPSSPRDEPSERSEPSNPPTPNHPLTLTIPNDTNNNNNPSSLENEPSNIESSHSNQPTPNSTRTPQHHQTNLIPVSPDVPPHLGPTFAISSSSERVRVIVRVRPLPTVLPGSTSSNSCLKVTNPTSIQILTRDKKGFLKYAFDRCYPPSSTQKDLYSYVRPAIEEVINGVNTTVFAYGQTGTGKTHTMLGVGLEGKVSGKYEDFKCGGPGDGVIPRALKTLFTKLSSLGEIIKRRGSVFDSKSIVNSPSRNSNSRLEKYSVMCSYMQVYNEQVYDLLNDENNKKMVALSIRESNTERGKNLYVQGLSEYRVGSEEDVLQLLWQGGRNRMIRSTDYNEQSSRSHAILQLLTEVEVPGGEGRTIIRRAKLNLVDLAGSEKWGTGEKDKTTQKELVKINSSLAALGNCISALANKTRTHIPYRESPLTRLLQDSLGGGTRTIVIATVSPQEQEESAGTLQFCNRASRVKAKIQVNEVVNDAVLLKRAQREISRLKQRLAEAVHLSKADKPGSEEGSSRENTGVPRTREERRSISASSKSSGGLSEKPRPPLPLAQNKKRTKSSTQSQDPLEHSLTEKELKKLNALTIAADQYSEKEDTKLEMLESKFERREADLLKEIDSLRSMVLGIVETENGSNSQAPTIPNLQEQQIQSEVQQLKSSKEQMESMVIEMRNNMREMEKRMADADSNTSNLINSLQKGEITQKQLKTEMKALLRIKGDVDFERKLAESQERLAAMGVVSPNKKKRKESHMFDHPHIHTSASDLTGSEALARVYATLGDDAKQLMIEAATPTSKRVECARDDPNSNYYVPTVQIPDPIMRKLESPPDPVRVTKNSSPSPEQQVKEELFNYPESTKPVPRPADFMRNSLLNSLLDGTADDQNQNQKSEPPPQPEPRPSLLGSLLDSASNEDFSEQQPPSIMSQLSSLLDAAAEEQNTLNPIADIASEEGSPIDNNNNNKNNTNPTPNDNDQLTELSRPPSEEQPLQQSTLSAQSDKSLEKSQPKTNMEQSTNSTILDASSMSMSNFFQEEGPAAQFNEPSQRPFKVPQQVTPLKLSSQEGDGNSDDDDENISDTDREEKEGGEEAEKMGEKRERIPIVMQDLGSNPSDSSDEEHSEDDDDDDENTRRTSRASGTSHQTNSSSHNSAENSFNEKHLDRETPGRERGNSFRPLSSQFRPGSSLRPGSSMRPMSKAASFRRGSRTPGLRLKTPSTARPPPTREGELSYAVIGLATVLHDFEAEEQGDLSLKAGTVVQVVEKEELWWRGKYEGGEVGLFPSNFVETIAATEQLAEINRRERDRHRNKRGSRGGAFESFSSKRSAGNTHNSNPGDEFGAVKEVGDEERDSEVGSVMEGGGDGSNHGSPTNKNMNVKVTSHQTYDPPNPPQNLDLPQNNNQQVLSSAVINASIKPCDRHGLTSCVLCSLNLSGVNSLFSSSSSYANSGSVGTAMHSMNPLMSMSTGGGANNLSPINSKNLSKTTGSVSTSFEFSAAVQQSKPCERHYLMNCVLCSGKYQSSAPSHLTSVAGINLANTHSTHSNHTSPLQQRLDPIHHPIHQPISVNTSTMTVSNASGGGQQCTRHNLKDCFLCSLQSKPAPQQTPQTLYTHNTLNMSPSHSKFNASYGMNAAPDTAESDYGGGTPLGYGTSNGAGMGSPMSRSNPGPGGLTLTSIPYSASTSFQPHSSETVFMGGGVSPQAGMVGGNIGGMSNPNMSPDVHGTPVGQPTQAHPIRMDRYQFGDGPTLALGMTTSRSITSPGASSTYSAERSDYDYKMEQEEENARQGVTWSAEVVTREQRQQQQKQEEDGLARRQRAQEDESKRAQIAALAAMDTKEAGNGGGITYEDDAAPAKEQQKGGGKVGGGGGKRGGYGGGGGVNKKRTGGGGGGKVKAVNKNVTSAYNVNQNATKKNNRGGGGGRGEGGGGGGGGGQAKNQKKKSKINPDTLSRAQYAIAVASETLLDSGPA